MNYLDVFIDDPETADFVLETLLRAVHGVNAKRGEQDRLIIAFPHWQAPAFAAGVRTERGSFGEVLRVFGSPEALEQLAVRSELQVAQASALARVSPAAPVPVATTWTRFVRERGLERRRTPAYLRRRARRQGFTEIAPLPRLGSERPHLAVGVQSGSTAQRFALRVARDDADVSTWPASVSTYGLATSPGGVPVF